MLAEGTVHIGQNQNHLPANPDPVLQSIVPRKAKTKVDLTSQNRISFFNHFDQIHFAMAGIDVEESSNCRGTFEHQLFLSFRGPDTRIFVGHLFSALNKAGFKVFLDNDGLEHGKDIQLKLYEAICRSEMSVVVLSHGYADSRWCLDELVKIMELEASKVHSVLPVFFDVEPTVVRHQTGVYMDAFEVLEKRFAGEMDRVEKWRSALGRIALLKGLSLGADRNEPLLVEEIIQSARKMTDTKPLYMPLNIIPRDRILKEIDQWLQDGSQEVEVGLIYGLGGIGKSTVAKIAYNRNSHTFDGCSFLAEFTRKTTQPDGLISHLKQVILDVTGKSGNKIHNVDKGLNDVRAILCRRRVLMVLDGTDELKYLPDAFDDPSFFGRGSKIIITSRNEELRKVSLFKKKFLIDRLNVIESMELLKREAYVNHKHISQHEEELLDGFLKHCHGLPLALHVLGPLLRKGTEEMWESLLEELQTYPNCEIIDVFELSFKCINDEYTKALFLYIACFFVGTNEAYAIKILEGCKLRPRSGLQNLIDRGLVNIVHGKLTMHQSIEEMGKEFARKESVDEPGKRSKIWSTKDSLSVLQNVKGTSMIRGMRVHLSIPDSPYISESHILKKFSNRISESFDNLNPWRKVSPLISMSIRTSSFTMMSNLELLLLNNVELEGDYKEFPKTLKWLLWRGCPLQSIPSNFNLDDLVALDMQKSCLTHAWKGCKYMGALKILNLSYSQRLVRTPDLSGAPMLEWLLLQYSTSLKEIHESIGKLMNITHLNLQGCTSLVRVHESIGNLKKLIILNLDGCKSLERFSIPTSVEQLMLADCCSFFPIHRSSSTPNLYLPTLKELNLARCGISSGNDLMELLNSAPSLEYLNVSYNLFSRLDFLKPRTSLRIKRLGVDGCSKLQTILQVPSSCSLLFYSWCSALKKVTFKGDSHPDILLIGDVYYQPIEVDFGSHHVVVELIDDMNERKANQLGFPNLPIFGVGTVLVLSDIERRGLGRGIYQAGTYQVILRGDHLTEWFPATTTTTTTELSYVVPLNQLPIRAINIGFVVVSGFLFLSHCNFIIKNMTSMWEWTLPIYNDYLDHQMTLTFLSHWSVMEHRAIKPGDLLSISFEDGRLLKEIKWGIKVIYEENNSGTTTACSKQENNEDMKGGLVWYNNNFRFPLHHFSTFGNNEDNKQMTRVYRAPKRILF